MFVGHLAVALAAKRVSPRTPLGPLVAGAFGLDLIWPILLLAGLERVRVAPGITAFTPLDFEHYPASAWPSSGASRRAASPSFR